MKFLKCIYLHPSPVLRAAVLCVHSHLWNIPYGIFPVGKGILAPKEPCQVWQCELCAFTLTQQHKSCSDSAPRFNQQLSQMMEASKCIFFGKLGWVSDPGSSRSCCSNSSGIALSCPGFAGIWVPCWAFKVKLSPFSFLLSGNIFSSSSLWVWQLGLIIPWQLEDFFPLSEAKKGQISSSSSGVSFAQEIGKVLFSSVSSLSLECKYWFFFFNYFFARAINELH